MKYKKPKYSGYKKMNRKSDFGSRSNKKRALIIGICIAVAVLIIAAVAIILVVNSSRNNGNGDNIGNGNNNNIIDNIFGNGDKNENVNLDEIKEIQIVRVPEKMSYYCGEWFDKTGLRVYTLTNGGKFANLSLDECTITGFDSSAPAQKQTITVTYQGFSDTFEIEIKEAPKPVTNALVSVALETLPKTAYKLGEWPETTGGVLLCTYTDGTTKRVDLEPAHVFGFAYAINSGVGEYDITVKYTEDGVTVETTYQITISE